MVNVYGVFPSLLLFIITQWTLLVGRGISVLECLSRSWIAELKDTDLKAVSEIYIFTQDSVVSTQKSLGILSGKAILPSNLSLRCLTTREATYFSGVKEFYFLFKVLLLSQEMYHSCLVIRKKKSTKYSSLGYRICLIIWNI